jgi:hypothetical protein
MKPAHLLFCLALGTIAGQACAKENCSVFRANLMGLEWAEEHCEQTPKIKEWMAEERIRVAQERKQRQAEEAASANQK